MQETCKLETMLTMVALLRELGGDLSRVNIVGNDFVAVAGNPNSSQCILPMPLYMTPPLCLSRAFLIHRC